MQKAKVAQLKPYVQNTEPGKYYWCACGQSNNQPFCDGSHQGTDFVPEEIEITETRKVAWCGCKQSAKGAFCDGAHVKL